MHRSILFRSLILATLGVTFVGAPAAVAQDGSVVPNGITVLGTGEASAPAETATLHFAISEESFGPPLPPAPGATPGAREREAAAPIVDALVAAGVPEDSIEVVVGPYVSEAYGPFGPAVALFRVELADPNPEGITALVDAATAAAAEDRRFVSGISVTYGVEDCEALALAAREGAIADARSNAEDQAALLDVTVGELVASRDRSFELALYGMAPPAGSCSPIEPPGFSPTQFGFSSFDPTAPAEVTVYAQVELTFAMAAGTVATPGS